MRKIILVTVFILSIFSTFAQTNFKMEMRKANPTKEDPTIPIEKKIQLHKDFLQKAIVEKNEKNQLFGHFYLLVDYYKIQDYVAVNKCLLDAEIIVNKSKNLSWKGAFAMRKSLVLDLKDDKQGVLKQYQLAFEFCRQAKDSLCMAESLEQISTTYGELDNLVKADEYFKKALPLLEKFADSQQMALTYNNYSNLLSYKKDYSEAINYSEKAIVMA